MKTVGIDFGTTNSVVASWRGDRTEVVAMEDCPVLWQPYGFDGVFPSVMAKDAHDRLTFGWTAKLLGRNPFLAVKRLFATQSDVAVTDDGDAINVEEVATMLFAEMRRRALAVGMEADAAVITVPANSKGRARHRTKICAGMAGFEVLALINEPTAAAMAYAQTHPDARRLLVFDWGGGTLDVTILRSQDGVFIEEASSGLPTNGGIDFDSRLRKIVEDIVPDLGTLTAEERAEFRNQIELAKIRLSDREFTNVEIPGRPHIQITRSQFEAAIRPLIEESRIPIEGCLKELGIGPGSLDALVLVGGTCRIPAVRDFVKNLVGLDYDPKFNPMTAVGEGAAIAAAILSGELTTSDFFVSTAHALGTFTFNPISGEQEFSTIIPKGHKLPVKAAGEYSPIVRETDSVEVEVIEGDPDGVIQDFTALKRWDVQLLKEYGEDSKRAFTLQYEYDVNGILHVTAIDLETSTVLLQDDVSYGIATDKREMKKLANRARDAVETGTLSSESKVILDDPEAVKLINLARTKVIPFLEDEESEQILKIVEALEHSDPSDRTSARDALRRALAPHSYLF